MVRLQSDSGSLTVAAGSYTLVYQKDRPFVLLKSGKGDLLAELFILSSAHTLQGLDDTTDIEEWEIADGQDEVLVSVHTSSSIWDRKTIRFRCAPDHIRYEVVVQGAGKLTQVDYFGGYYSGQMRWGSGFFYSGQSFAKIFSPEPNREERNYLSPLDSPSIDLMGVPLPGRADWFFTPPPFCFAFQGQQGWMGLGVEARPGEHQFTAYQYHGHQGGFYLSLSYEGYTAVEGEFYLPAIGIYFAGDEFQVLEAHVDALHKGNSAAPQAGGKASWWFEPIFCGWGAQNHLAMRENGSPFDYSRQDLYEQFLATLSENGLVPGTVVLDDKWQASYGRNEVDLQKWPDLTGFVHARHQNEMHVLLWLKAWDPEGLPEGECIRNHKGKAIAADPTHPGYEKRLRASVRRMLSPDGYDADGFKIDFTARIPSGPGMVLHGREWGLELMKKYLEIIYSEAKQTKPDALVMTHTPHPYLAAVTDMIRLNDINRDQDVIRSMRLRAKIARIACPQAVIDTDNWPVANRKSWRRYVGVQRELGVPSLYFASHIDLTNEPLNSQDYSLIRRAWAKDGGQKQPRELWEKILTHFPWGTDRQKDSISRYLRRRLAG